MGFNINEAKLAVKVYEINDSNSEGSVFTAPDGSTWRVAKVIPDIDSNGYQACR